MILDASLLMLIIGFLQYISYRYPNFLFFPRGATLFLPPQQGSKQIKAVRVSYEDVKDNPLSSQFSRIVHTLTSLSIYTLIRPLLHPISSTYSLTGCFILIAIGGYMIKIGVDILLLSIYNRRVIFWVCCGTNTLFFTLWLTLGGVEGVYDNSLILATSNYNKHLSIIFGKQINFMSPHAVIVLILIINSFIMATLVPSVIKLGNWYAKLLKDSFSQKESSGKQNSQGKDQTARTLRHLNLYLCGMMGFICLSHNYFRTYLPEPVIDILRVLLMGGTCLIILNCLRGAIQFNGSFAYKHVLNYLKASDEEEKKQFQMNILQYLYHIWYHCFQFASRAFFPLLLFLIVLNFKYVSMEPEPYQSRHSSCLLNTDELSILQGVYHCAGEQGELFINGAIFNGQFGVKGTQALIEKYGLVTRELLVEVSELVLWYGVVSLEAMSVLYILFLRKTIYDL